MTAGTEHQDEPQALHVRGELDGCAHALAVGAVRTQGRVIVADADLTATPGDDEGLGVHDGDATGWTGHLA